MALCNCRTAVAEVVDPNRNRANDFTNEDLSPNKVSRPGQNAGPTPRSAGHFFLLRATCWCSLFLTTLAAQSLPIAMVNFYGKEVSSSADWTLQTCCDAREYIFIALYFVYGLIIHCLFHRGSIMKPFKLLGVFFHEWSHASATWITCGKVKKIEGAYVRVGRVVRSSA
jgi:hypothetical protein